MQREVSDEVRPPYGLLGFKGLINFMHKICFIISFISCFYMFRAHVLIIRRSKLHYTASGIITLKQVSGLKLLKYLVIILEQSLVFIVTISEAV